MTLDEAPDSLKPSEAIAILRIGKNQFYREVAEGRIYACRIGRSLRIPKAALAAFLNGPHDRAERQIT